MPPAYGGFRTDIGMMRYISESLRPEALTKRPMSKARCIKFARNCALMKDSIVSVPQSNDLS